MKKEFFVVFGIVFLILLFFLYKTNPYNKINGNYDLQCFMKDGWRVIDKNRIVGFIDEKNIWVFDNGYARNCKIIKREEK